MVREYVDQIYSPASEALSRRIENGAKLASELEACHAQLRESWGRVRFGDVQITKSEDRWHVEAQVFIGKFEPDRVRVELYADPLNGDEPPMRIALHHRDSIPGAVNGHVYQANFPSTRPAHHFTPRITPFHPDVLIPLEESFIVWKR
jgi:starch phosphorylase